MCAWFHSSLRRHLKPVLYFPSLFRLTPETSYKWSEHVQLQIHSSSVSGSQKIKSQFTVQMCFIWCLQDRFIFSEHKAHLRHGLTVTLDKSAGWKWRRQKMSQKKIITYISYQAFSLSFSNWQSYLNWFSVSYLNLQMHARVPKRGEVISERWSGKIQRQRIIPAASWLSNWLWRSRRLAWPLHCLIWSKIIPFSYAYMIYGVFSVMLFSSRKSLW